MHVPNLAALEKHFDRPLSRGEKIAVSSKICCYIMATPSREDLELVPRESLPLSPEVQADFTKRGLEFLGTVGVGSDPSQCLTALEAPLGDVASDAIGFAFSHLRCRETSRAKA